MPTEIKGATSLRKALRNFAPDLAKSTQKEMGKALRTITTKAKSFMPSDDQMLSGWTSQTSSADTIKYRPFPKYSQAEAKRGIKFYTTPSKPNRSGFRALARVVNQSAGGAIFETAGRKSGPDGQPHQETTRGKYSSYIDTSNKVSKSLNPNAGKQFIARANAVGDLVNARELKAKGRPTRKMTGRVIFRAWKEDGGKANAAVLKAIEKAGLEFNRRKGKA